jgi:uncharacterized protein (DUF3084 family)
MSYSRTSKQLKELQLRAAELQQQYRELAAGKRALHIRNGLLSAMCDALCFIQIKLACTYSSSQVEQEGGAVWRVVGNRSQAIAAALCQDRAPVTNSIRRSYTNRLGLRHPLSLWSHVHVTHMFTPTLHSG